MSQGQQAFARRNDATPAWRASNSSAVFMYRVASAETTRWLVDEAGSVLECWVFHRLVACHHQNPNRGAPPPVRFRNGNAAGSGMESFAHIPSPIDGTDANAFLF